MVNGMSLADIKSEILFITAAVLSPTAMSLSTSTSGENPFSLSISILFALTYLLISLF